MTEDKKPSNTLSRLIGVGLFLLGFYLTLSYFLSNKGNFIPNPNGFGVIEASNNSERLIGVIIGLAVLAGGVVMLVVFRRK